MFKKSEHPDPIQPPTLSIQLSLFEPAQRNLKVYESLQSFQHAKRPVMTTGTFDGVHFGHQKILERLTDVASEVDGESVLFTFDPHPRMVLFPDDHGLQLLNSREEKIERLEACGLDHLIIHPFSKEFARLTPLEYVKQILVDAVGVNTMVVGYDHRFGRHREGDFSSLQQFGEMFQFRVEEIPAQMLEEVNVSSTKIRSALSEGDVHKANEYLRYNYPLRGIVIEGDGIGKDLGFPTANVQIHDKNKLIPAKGVYAVLVHTDQGTFKGMLNIGVRPTVTKSEELRIEVHLLDAEQNLYGQSIALELIDRIRDEQRFDGLDALVAQLQNDKEKVLARLS